MPTQWYLARDRQRTGPYSLDQLRHMAASGELAPEDMVWQEGAGQWVPADSVRGLFAAAGSAPRPGATAITDAAPEAPLPVRHEAATDWGDDYPEVALAARPTLWNPNAAANWSLLFTPIFGAALHAINWRVLGRPGRATANVVWIVVTAVFLVINAVSVFLPGAKGVDGAMKFVGLGLLIGWYFTQGKPQAQYVKEELPGGYRKRSWAAPIGIAVGGVVGYLVLVFALAFFLYRPSADDLAAEVRPLILAEWQKQPEMRGVTIQRITLEHKGGKRYAGFVDATLNGQAERLALEVEYGNGMIRWEVRPMNPQGRAPPRAPEAVRDWHDG
jgi:hypothetical protein